MRNLKKYIFTLFTSLAIISGLFFSFTSNRQRTGNKEDEKRILIVSDIHFNPFSGTSLNDTALKSKLIRSSFDEWKRLFDSIPAQKTITANLLGQDANYAVLKAALDNMKMKLPHPSFIVIAGDFIWHGATPADSSLKRKSIQFIASLFKERFPDTPIIPAMGNNDTYGKDYALQDTKFLNDFASAWEPNLPKKSADTLKAQGYYTWETGNLQLIVINSAQVSAGSNYPTAGLMLNWMKWHLINANGKKTWIIMHIPPGLNSYTGKDNWNGDHKETFVSTIVKYAPAVTFMIGSHTHFNDFKVVYSASGNPVSFMRIVPSVGSNHFNNPSFEIAELNTNTGEVVHETNWYLNLATVSKMKNTRPMIWTDTLNLFPSTQKHGLKAKDFSAEIADIKSDKTGKALHSFIHFYTVGTDADSTLTINHKTYLKYLKADSLKEK